MEAWGVMGDSKFQPWLGSGLNRLEPNRALQVQSGDAQQGHHACVIFSIAVGVLMVRGVPDPVPTFVVPSK